MCITIVFSLNNASASIAINNTNAPAVFNLNIPRGDAATTLNQLAQQTDTVIIFSFEQVSKRQTNAIYGYFTFDDALKYLLEDSGLQAISTPKKGIQISLKKPSIQTVQAKAELKEETKSIKSVEIIEVAGIRKSMLKSRDMKRNSDSIIDVIVAEDIGKLPDITAAESIARLPGVQVTRFDDETSGILVRGLPFHATTYNGREIFTAELRRLQLQDMPAQMLAGIELYKPGTVNIIEPGLAGIINATTRRPFDFTGEKIAGEVRMTYNDQSAQTAPNGNLLYSNRWKTDAGQFGLLTNMSMTEDEFYNGVRFASFWYNYAQPTWDISPSELAAGNFFFPANIGLYNSGGKRTRPSANFALQWQPQDNLEFYSEGIYQGYRRQGYIDYFSINLDGVDSQFGPPKLDKVELLSGTTDQVLSFTKSGGIAPNGYRGTNSDQTNTNQLAIGVIWSNDILKIHSDIAYTNSSYRNEEWNVDFALREPQTVEVNFNQNGGVAFDLPNFDAFDEDAYLWRGYFESTKLTQGDGLQWRTDISYFTAFDFIHTIKMGARYTDRNASIANGSRYANILDLSIPLKHLPLGSLVSTPNPFRDNTQGFVQYLAPHRENIINNHGTLRQLTLNAINDMLVLYPNRTELYSAQQAFSSERLDYDPASSFLTNEKSYALYLQGAVEFELGTTVIDGMAGLRLLKIDRDALGSSTITNQDYSYIEAKRSQNNYYDLLPAISLRAMLSRELYVRLGYTKALTPLDFSLLNPAFKLTQQNNSDGLGQPINNYGSSGNPQLEPLTSTNFDLSIEYYFSNKAYLSMAGFYRNLFGFPNEYKRLVDDPDYGVIELSRPENSDKGKIFGYELSGQTFFDFLPTFWQGMGLSTNITYLNSAFRQKNLDGSFSAEQKITGLSDWTYNFTAFYENSVFSTRLSYNYRSPWINWYGEPTANGNFTGRKTHARERLDLSISYDISPQYKLYFDIRNLTAKPFRDYMQLNETQHYNIDVRDEGRYFGMGLRFNY